MTALLALAACTGRGSQERPENRTQPDQRTQPEPRTQSDCGRSLDAELRQLSENSSNEISKRLLGVVKIMDRDMDDGSGHSSRRLSVELIVFDPATKQERHDNVAVGNSIIVGDDAYCLVDIYEGKGDELGWVALRRIAQ
ncbi:MAG: hypothetical protein HOV81_31215 [Kofleriaceae bacterium]|nr:hypothetical protein [Kofleriaceae bacterium]